MCECQKLASLRGGCGGPLSILSLLSDWSLPSPLPKSMGNSPPLYRWMLCLLKLSDVNPVQSRRCISCTFTRLTLAEWVLTCTLGKRTTHFEDRNSQWISCERAESWEQRQRSEFRQQGPISRPHNHHVETNKLEGQNGGEDWQDSCDGKAGAPGVDHPC